MEIMRDVGGVYLDSDVLIIRGEQSKAYTSDPVQTYENFSLPQILNPFINIRS